MAILAEWLLFPVISRLAFLSNLFMVFLADRGASSLCQDLPRWMKYDSVKKRWFMPNVAKTNIKRRTARQALLFGVNSIYRLMWEWVVEARGVEPLSRNIVICFSPSAVCVLGFARRSPTDGLSMHYLDEVSRKLSENWAYSILLFEVLSRPVGEGG